MNKTQRTIIIIGSEKQLRNALDILKDFKAITPIKNLTPEHVKNVYAHNKNVLHLAIRYDIEFDVYSPLVFHLSDESSSIETCTLSLSNILEDFPSMLDNFDIDVGDHIIYESSNCHSVENKCLLCKIRDGKSERKEHILYQSKNFYVVPGLGAFFKGYLMLVPKRHVMSFAELNKDEFSEFQRVINDLRTILQGIYGKKVFTFECGSGRNGSGKHATSIVHAHFHLAPSDINVFQAVCESGLNPSLIELDSLVKYGEFPYMLYGTQDNEWYICSDPDSYFPRQHPRQILADYMGLPKGAYNWRTHPHNEEMDVIADEFIEFVKNEFSKLPKWIQEATKHLF